MKVTHDQQADAAYLAARDEPITQTIPFGERVNVDVDALGRIVGIELLAVSSQPSLARLLAAQAAIADPPQELGQPNEELK